MQTISKTLQILLFQFHGQILIPFADAVFRAGFEPQTARNLLAKGSFPISSVTNSSKRRFIHVSDLADYIDSLASKEQKKKRGAPTKKSRIEAAAALRGEV